MKQNNREFTIRDFWSYMAEKANNDDEVLRLLREGDVYLLHLVYRTLRGIDNYLADNGYWDNPSERKYVRSEIAIPKLKRDREMIEIRVLGFQTGRLELMKAFEDMLESETRSLDPPERAIEARRKIGISVPMCDYV